MGLKSKERDGLVVRETRLQLAALLKTSCMMLGKTLGLPGDNSSALPPRGAGE